MDYVAFRDNLINTLSNARIHCITSSIFSKKRTDPIFAVTGKDDKLYNALVSRFTIIIYKETGALFTSLCEEYGISYQGTRGASYICDLKGGKTKVRFIESSNNLNFESCYRMLYDDSDLVDNIILVLLQKDSIEGRKNQEQCQRRMERACEHFEKHKEIKCVLLSDFLEDVFGSQESISFHKAMRDIDSQLRETLGYYLTELCSSENKLLFKKEMESHLLTFDYDLMKQNSLILMREKNKWVKDLFWEKYAEIKKQFIENGRYKLLLGEKDFAESFFSSEWLIYKTEDSPLLDNTYKVAGYLKSVEELLWDIIILLGEGRTIAGKAYGEQYQINEKNYNDINATLGSLQRFLSDYSNQDLFLDAFGDGRRFVSDYLKQQISFWRDNYRNGFFHKHNLNDLEKVKQIRNQTIFLYMVILGSLDLRTEDLEELMY